MDDFVKKTFPDAPRITLMVLCLLFLGTTLNSLAQDAAVSPETLPPVSGGPAAEAGMSSVPQDAQEQFVTDSPAEIDSTIDTGTAPPFDPGFIETLIQQGQWQQVEELVRVYNHAPTGLRIGWYYYEGGDYLLAEQWFNQALTWLEEFPGDQQNAGEVYPNALYGKGLALFQSERYTAAEEFAREYRDASPQLQDLLADTLLIQAGAAMKQGRYRDALDAIEEAKPLRQAGFSADELLLEGWANYNIGWASLEQFRNAGEVYYRDVAMEYLDKAATAFLNSFPLIAEISDTAARERTRNSALEGLARAEYARGNYREAYRIVSSPNFTSETAEEIRREIRTGVLAQIYEELSPQQKVQYLEALRQRDPLTIEQKLDHAMQYMQLRQFETAAAIFGHILSQNPPPAIAAQSYMGLAFSSNEIGQPVTARAAAERALELRHSLESDSSGALQQMLVNIDASMAVAAYDNKDYALALQLTERVRAVRPLNLGERAIEAWSHLHLENPRQAFPEFVSLYSDVRQIEPLMRETQTFLPDYLRTPQQQTTVPQQGTTWPYYQPAPATAPAQNQSPLPPYLYERQQPSTSQPALPGYLQSPSAQQPVTPQVPSYNAPYAAPPLSVAPVPRQKHPLMRNIFDVSEEPAPPSLFDEPEDAAVLVQNQQVPADQRRPADFLPDDSALFGQGDISEPAEISPEFASEIMRDEFGVDLTQQQEVSQYPSAPAGTSTVPTYPNMPPATYASPATAGEPTLPPSLDKSRPRQISDGELDQLLSELTGRQSLVAPAPQQYQAVPPAQVQQTTTTYTTAVTPVTSSAAPAEPVADRFYQGQYVPRLEDLGQGVFLSGVRSGQIEEVKRLARQWGGPLAQETADRLRKRKLYTQVLEMRPDVEPALQNYDTSRLSVGTAMRSKSGQSGLGEMTVFHFPIVTYEQKSIFGDESDRIALQASAFSVDSGSLDAESAFGRFPRDPYRTGRETPETSYDNLFELKLKWWEEDWTSRFVELGLTPVNGPISATLTGRLGIRQQIDRGYWRGEIFRESRKESVLSYVGTKDPYSGEVWGQVVENGISLEGLLGLEGGLPQTGENLLREEELSLFGKATIGFLSGDGVADNTHFGLTMALQKQFKSERFDYLLGGIAFSAEQYADNLGHFTSGHGGYFSPEYLLQTNVFVQFLTQEGYEHLIGGSVMLGYQTNSQEAAPYFPLSPDGRFYSSERSSTPIAALNVEGAFLLNHSWKAGVTLNAATTANYDEFYAGLTLTYFFEPRKGLYSTDLGLPFSYP